MQITYFGHSCFQVEIGRHKLLFDPFITPNPLAAKIKVSAIKPDFILLSHAHGDHIADAEQIAKASGAVLISTHEVVTYFAERGIEKNHPMNHGGKKTFDFGTVKMVNAVHSSSFPDGTYGGNPVGFVVETVEKTFYYAGDTALHYDMKLIGEQYKIDFAFLPIGDNYTMDIADAVTAADFVKTNKIIGMHYDTFPYIKIDKLEAGIIAKAGGKELVLLDIGEKIKL